MSTTIQRDKLFVASCLALLVTSLSFGIRAGILGILGEQFGLTKLELGNYYSYSILGISAGSNYWWFCC